MPFAAESTTRSVIYDDIHSSNLNQFNANHLFFPLTIIKCEPPTMLDQAMDLSPTQSNLSLNSSGFFSSSYDSAVSIPTTCQEVQSLAQDSLLMRILESLQNIENELRIRNQIEIQRNV